jgi:sugar lactone lactonase YvrE
MAVCSPAVAEDLRLINVGAIVESAVVTPDGKIFVSVVGAYEKYGDGYVGVVDGDKVVPLATGLNDPHGLDYWNDALYAADNRGQIWRIDMNGNVSLVADATKFPRKITNFNDIELDANGNIYISDSGDWEGRGGAIYRITQDGKVSTVLTDEEAWQLISPNGLLMDGDDAMLVLDWTTGNLHRLELRTRFFEKVNGKFGAGDGLAWDPQGRLYVASYYESTVYVLDKPDSQERRPIKIEGVKSVADIGISPDGKLLVAPDFDGGQVAIVPLSE